MSNNGQKYNLSKQHVLYWPGINLLTHNTNTRLTALFRDYPGELVPER